MPTISKIQKDHLWVVAPIYNEEECVILVLNEWLPALRALNTPFTFLFINDGSTDRSLLVLREQQQKNSEIQIISKSNAGHGRACVDGYIHSLNHQANWVLQIDADGQCVAAHILEFWKSKKRFPIQFGFRATRGDGWIRTFFSRLFSLFCFMFTGQFCKDINVPYRLMRADLLAPAVKDVPHCYFANALTTARLQRAYGIHWRNISFRKRPFGRSKLTTLRFATSSVGLFLHLFKDRVVTTVKGLLSFGKKPRSV